MDFQLYIDMDGVFVDFLGGAVSWYGIEYCNPIDDWPLGQYGDDTVLYGYYGLTKTQFWSGITEDFWETLDYMPDGKEFLEAIEQYKPVICTSPPLHGGSSGKQEWIRNNLPEYYRNKRYIITPDKKYVASFKRILIDDKEKNIEEWEAAGGLGILYPRRWNKLHYIKEPLEYVILNLESILKALNY